MALTDNITVTFQRPDLSKPSPPMNAAAAVELFTGAFLCFDGSGDIVPAPVTGALVFAGVSKEHIDNLTGAITTDKPVEFQTVEILKYAVTGADNTNIGDKVYYTDDNVLSMTIVPSTGVAGSQVGRLHGFDTDSTALTDFSKDEF